MNLPVLVFSQSTQFVPFLVRLATSFLVRTGEATFHHAISDSSYSSDRSTQTGGRRIRLSVSHMSVPRSNRRILHLKKSYRGGVLV